MARETKKVRGAARQTREAESRVMQSHVLEDDDTPWIQGQSLVMPPARPGMDQRWIRVMVREKEDVTNWARKQREGWKPRSADSVPKDFPVPTIDHGKHAGCIGIEGSILCERPLSMSERRTKYFRGIAQKRTNAINNDLEKLNRESRNPAFGPVQMATKAVPVREVSREVQAQED